MRPNIVLCLLLMAFVIGAAEAPRPPATRTEEVVDEVQGVKITDPYRWLEDGGNNAVREWVDGQNTYTRGLLDGRPGRGAGVVGCF